MNRDNLTSEVTEFILTRDISEFETLNVDAIARKFKITRPYLSHKFITEKNVSLSDYIFFIKILRSTMVLVDKSRLKVEDLSRMMGFSRTDYFIHIFKNIIGVTPGKYRDILKKLKSQNMLELE
jgi:YesN/AraC family two-component response regulator